MLSVHHSTMLLQPWAPWLLLFVPDTFSSWLQYFCYFILPKELAIQLPVKKYRFRNAELPRRWNVCIIPRWHFSISLFWLSQESTSNSPLFYSKAILHNRNFKQETYLRLLRGNIHKCGQLSFSNTSASCRNLWYEGLSPLWASIPTLLF